MSMIYPSPQLSEGLGGIFFFLGQGVGRVWVQERVALFFIGAMEWSSRTQTKLETHF